MRSRASLKKTLGMWTVPWIGFMTSAFVAVACSAGGGDSGFNNNPSTDGGTGGSNTGGSGGSGGMINPDSGKMDAPPTVATLEGRVVAPEGTIPISSALVYLSDTPPAPIPDGVFCDECVQLGADDEYALTSPDGTFSLSAYSTGPQYLIVQKGQFRKVRNIDVAAGSQQVDPEFTRLPGRMNKAAGEDIPKMAVIVGQWDAIEVSLAKLGLAELVTGPYGFQTVNPDTAGFTMVQPMQNPDNYLKDWNLLSQFHIVFIPCSGSDGTTCTDTLPDNPQVQENLQRFVNEGGKLYVTDYSYEYVRRPWPGFVTWDSENPATGSACLTGDYTAPATVDDPEMKEWLAAQGIFDFEVEANWTRITSLHTQPGLDPQGATVDITPTAWVKGNGNPCTISFQERCGRVLFSTYHTEGNGNSGLLAQEKALLYVLLEVGVCVGPPIPPK